MKIEEQELVTGEWVCEKLKIRPKTLYEWVSLKKIKVTKVGNRNRFRPSDVEEAIQRYNKEGQK